MENKHTGDLVRANGYAFFSACFYPPGDSFTTDIENAGNVCGAMAEDIRCLARNTDVEDIKRDYVRLFVGPFKTLAPPCGSLYMEQDGCFMGDSSVDVQRWYEEDGLTNTLHEPPDHVIVELEYLHFLAGQALRTADDGRSDQADRYREREQQFLSLHFARWAMAFANNIETNAETEFYRCVARIMSHFLKESAIHLPIASA